MSASKLTGGKQGTFPTIEFFETRTYSPNLIFNPIDQNFLFRHSNSPNIIVTVNNLKSVCLNNCEYSFLANNPLVSSQVLSGNQVLVTISNPSNMNYDTSVLSATVDGQECFIPLGPSFTSFTCELPQNSDSSPVLTAGYHNI